MERSPLQQEISIIRDMLEKTRREAAESGNFFIVIGLVCSVIPLAVSVFERYDSGLVLPVLVVFTVLTGFLSYLVIAREEKNEKVKTYAKAVNLQLWFVCGSACLLITFLFPWLDVYPLSAVTVLVFMVIGIMVYSTGAVLELRFLKWFSMIWWAGAVVMAVVPLGKGGPVITSAIILLGWVLPGLVLKKNYRNRRAENGS